MLPCQVRTKDNKDIDKFNRLLDVYLNITKLEQRL